MSEFRLDARLARDSTPILKLGLCDLRLMNDSRWPWLLLVPQRPGLVELHDMRPLDQALLTFEQMMVATALKSATGAEKINVGALGNIVRQVHVHVIARSEGDANWPGPVWGFGSAIPYEQAARDTLIHSILEVLQ